MNHPTIQQRISEARQHVVLATMQVQAADTESPQALLRNALLLLRAAQRDLRHALDSCAAHDDCGPEDAA